MSVHVVMTFPHSLGVVGGGVVHCQRLVLQLREAGAEVTLIPVATRTLSLFPRPTPPAAGEGRVAQILEGAGTNIKTLPQSPFAWWFDGLGVRSCLTALLDERPVDAVLGWWGELSYSIELLEARGVFSGLLAAAPYSLWWSRTPGRPRWLQRRMDDHVIARTARSVSRVFANSRHTAAEVTSLLGVDPANIEVVHPPLGAIRDRRARVRESSIERLLFFGRLQREKGILDLMEALGNLEEAGWELRVAGAGDAESVRAAARKWDIVDRVKLLGDLGPEQLADELDWAQVAVLPSHEESFGLSVVEAQLAGLPVIAFDVGAVPEICLDGETGWLVPVHNVGRLADSIREALTQPGETSRRGRAARDRAQLWQNDSAASKILQTVLDWRTKNLTRESI